MPESLLAHLDHKHFQTFFGSGKVALAVSGGPDSMALALALSRYAQAHGGFEIYALTVDHGLREESWQEAESVHVMMAHWPHLTHSILKWEGEKPTERIQEAARHARYDLMSEYCAAHGIDGLFLAHHQGDQAETFLFRLAKGSGLDGLSCMQAVSARGDLQLLRPFLDVPKADLICFCKDNNIAYFDDPSNEKKEFARVRLRKSKEVLEAEGLSDKRLSVSAARLARARVALDLIAERGYNTHLFDRNTKRYVFNYNLCSEPAEIVLRILKRVIAELNAGAHGYGPREEKLEDLMRALIAEGEFRKRTLGGVVFEKKDGAITMTKEGAATGESFS